MKINSDYKLIKRDNTEIMHSLHSLSIITKKIIAYFLCNKVKKADHINSENNNLKVEIKNLKRNLKIDQNEKEDLKSKKNQIIKEENFEKPKRILLNENNIKEEM